MRGQTARLCWTSATLKKACKGAMVESAGTHMRVPSLPVPFWPWMQELTKTCPQPWRNCMFSNTHHQHRSSNADSKADQPVSSVALSPCCRPACCRSCAGTFGSPCVREGPARGGCCPPTGAPRTQIQCLGLTAAPTAWRAVVGATDKQQTMTASTEEQQGLVCSAMLLVKSWQRSCLQGHHRHTHE